ncbi:MAG: molybdate ABC transporter permease subunit, partial [Leptonema sp. (in: bacteria)]
MEKIFSNVDFTSFFLSLKLAFFTTILLLFISIPISYFLAYAKFRFKAILEAFISLPVVLPPTVVGFYLLIFLSKNGILGSLWERLFGNPLIFRFEGILIASVVFSLPFMVHPLTAGFRSVNKSLIEASYTLGKSKLTTLFKIIIPNIKYSFITGIVLTFIHTVGEFGVVLMVGGSIEGETKV